GAAFHQPALSTPIARGPQRRPLLSKSDSLQIPNPGGQGRIRTSVARKERQIYSLLPLTTRPPVLVSRAPQRSLRSLLSPSLSVRARQRSPSTSPVSRAPQRSLYSLLRPRCRFA